MLNWFCRIKQVPSYCQVMFKYFCRKKQVPTWREVPSYEVEIKRWVQCASQVRQLTGLENVKMSEGQKRREGVCKQNICTTITAGVIMEEALSELSSLKWYICTLPWVIMEEALLSELSSLSWYICVVRSMYITLSDNGRGEHHESRFHCQGNPTNPPRGQFA